MKNFFIVLKYTLLENIRKKSFIISTIIIVLLTIGVFNINNIIDAFSNKEEGEEGRKVIIIDEQDIYGSSLNNFKIPTTNYVLSNDNGEDQDSLKNKVENGELAGIVIIDEKEAVPSFKYIVKDEYSAPQAEIISAVIKNIYGTVTLQQFNIDEQIQANLSAPITYKVEQVSGKEKDITAYIMAMITTILLYFAIYFYGYSVSLSVSSEKTSRVMETLVTSTKPSSIVLGKTVAMGLLGLGQLLLLIITAFVSYKVFIGGEFIIGGEVVNFSNITLPMILLLILYFILGYALYAMLNAVTGSTVSKAEDLNSASMPGSFISLISFYLGYFSLMNPTSSVNVFASLMPFSSPFTMVSRMIMTSVPMWEIILSILFLIITIVLFAFISVRMYSAAILHYGSKLSLKDLFKMSKTS